MVNSRSICTVCRQPNPVGGKHYKCATGKEKNLDKIKRPEVKVVKPDTSHYREAL